MRHDDQPPTDSKTPMVEFAVRAQTPPSAMQRIRSSFSVIPMLGWLTGILCAVFIERFFGDELAYRLYLPKLPVLFGCLIMFKTPVLIPSALAYVILVYVIPVTATARLTAGLTNRLAAILDRGPIAASCLIHLGLLYLALHYWTDLSDYRLLVLKLTMIAVMLTLSLNLINGYMGEFSCSHPGFMALGAYSASTVTLLLFSNDRLFGAAVLPAAWGSYCFPLALIFGGISAAAGALLVAIPSFRTRGDYLAIISLAFMFIVKSLIENLEWLGGPRGMSGQPDWSSLPVVYAWMVACIWVVNNFVRSIYGKALNALRDNEMAAEAMTVNTRKTKITAFMLGAFWAGVAGGLFAHVMRFVNPGTFGIQRLAEVLAMVYFGGLNSVVGSIFGAVSINLISEMLRPLEIYKWIVIPVILILVMIYRPTGLLAFREFDVKAILRPKHSGTGQGA
ncbi:MAG: branched-chain amino acid ABC transporter permease [Desulfomonilaceae bacterium]|nr:branched-chain amino acid ABC transporter permease [Desulfomonilaceae bacterium]